MIDLPTFIAFIAGTAFLSIVAGMVLQAMLSGSARAEGFKDGREYERRQRQATLDSFEEIVDDLNDRNAA